MLYDRLQESHYCEIDLQNEVASLIKLRVGSAVLGAYLELDKLYYVGIMSYIVNIKYEGTFASLPKGTGFMMKIFPTNTCIH